MNSDFAPIGQMRESHAGENSFWPSFTDIMMVITMIFLMATSLLVVRNWQLVSELKESIAAEQIASRVIENTALENATLEERLANAEQSNSILRLRVLKKEEDLQLAEERISAQQASISQLNLDKEQLDRSLQQANNATNAATLEIERLRIEGEKLSNLLLNVEQQLARQQQNTDQVRAELSSAQNEIAELTQSSISQQASISELTRQKLTLDQEKLLQSQEIEAYNQQLLTLKGDYETVKSKYDELIKPARSAQGKYIAEVYYVKNKQRDIIRYKQPDDSQFTNLSLTEVEKRLDKLKQQYGKDLYVKIIIPENSGLTYNEAWTFMRNLLVKYDYYYQE